jgi:hypothetical protein
MIVNKFLSKQLVLVNNIAFGIVVFPFISTAYRVPAREKHNARQIKRYPRGI